MSSRNCFRPLADRRGTSSRPAAGDRQGRTPIAADHVGALDPRLGHADRRREHARGDRRGESGQGPRRWIDLGEATGGDLGAHARAPGHAEGQGLRRVGRAGVVVDRGRRGPADGVERRGRRRPASLRGPRGWGEPRRGSRARGRGWWIGPGTSRGVSSGSRFRSSGDGGIIAKGALFGCATRPRALPGPLGRGYHASYAIPPSSGRPETHDEPLPGLLRPLRRDAPRRPVRCRGDDDLRSWRRGGRPIPARARDRRGDCPDRGVVADPSPPAPHRHGCRGSL